MKVYGKGKHSNIVKNEYILKDDYAILILSNGKEAKIDIEDIEKLSKYTWNSNGKGYAQSKINNSKIIQQHRLIMDCLNDRSKIIDHINGNRLDNRKSNLRVVTYQENMFNKKPRKDSKSGFRGVYYRENKGKKWYTDIKVNYKTIHLGTFNTFEEAKKARLEAEQKYFKIGSTK